MLNRPVARELQTELEPELLRAVPLNLCMSGWAKHFVPPDPGMFKVDHSNYDLSRQTEYYDEFLSHDWETSRWYKLCTMLMIYNSRAAFFCSLVVSIAVGILRATKILPDGLWIQLSVFAVFPLVLCFWQRIRIMFARPLVVFLDKLCIAQHDEELKQKGIFGLAGFLDHSRQLTIFWSHRYFSRLWCTYEVGTFLRAKKQKLILVIPVKLAVILCLFFVAELVIMVGYFMLSNLKLESTVNDVEELFSFFLLFSLFYMPCLPLLFYLGIGMMSDLKELPQQLRKFRVQDAKCFCCSHKHRHPDTGEVLPCDRELMFQMLQKWFGKAGDLKEEHLEVFNRLVHEDLAPRVLRSVGSDALPFNYSIYMVVVNTLPGLCTLIPTLVAGPPDSFNRFNILQHSIWASREIMNWLFAGVVVLYALRLSMRGWLIAVTLLPHCPRHNRVICSILMPVLMSVMLATQWFSFQLALSHSEQDSLFPAIPFIAWLLVLFCFWSWGAPSTSSTAGNSFAAEPPIFKEEVLSSIDVDGNNRKTDDDSASTFST